MNRRRVSTAASMYLINPFVKVAARLGLPLPGIVILETTGRRSGKPRRTPVGKALEGETLWIVVEHGQQAAYVKNIIAEPRVRVRIGRRWRRGTAFPMPEDDWRERQRQIPNKANSAVVRLMKSEPMTLRIELEAP